MDSNRFHYLGDLTDRLIKLAKENDLIDPYTRGYVNGMITINNLYQRNTFSTVTEDDALFKKLQRR